MEMELVYKFQSTLPAWGETALAPARPDLDAISIHSPRMGRDPPDVKRCELAELFQSTLPAWGETKTAFVEGMTRDISIHSPRMGRDI